MLQTVAGNKILTLVLATASLIVPLLPRMPGPHISSVNISGAWRNWQQRSDRFAAQHDSLSFLFFDTPDTLDDDDYPVKGTNDYDSATVHYPYPERQGYFKAHGKP